LKVEYHIDYQHLPKGAKRPIDDGEIVGIRPDDDIGPLPLPSVGDFVEIDNSADGGERSSFHGRVRTRLFRYLRAREGNISCFVNIVVEDTDDDWSKLIKE
jgi:hypothetical protein